MCSEEMGEVGGGVIHVETLKDFFHSMFVSLAGSQFY